MNYTFNSTKYTVDGDTIKPLGVGQRWVNRAITSYSGVIEAVQFNGPFLAGFTVQFKGTFPIQFQNWLSYEQFTTMLRFDGWDLNYSLAKADSKSKRFPHTCPRCNSEAYIGGGPADIDCSNESCLTKKKK